MDFLNFRSDTIKTKDNIAGRYIAGRNSNN